MNLRTLCNKMKWFKLNLTTDPDPVVQRKAIIETNQALVLVKFTKLRMLKHPRVSMNPMDMALVLDNQGLQLSLAQLIKGVSIKLLTREVIPTNNIQRASNPFLIQSTVHLTRRINNNSIFHLEHQIQNPLQIKMNSN